MTRLNALLVERLLQLACEVIARLDRGHPVADHADRMLALVHGRAVPQHVHHAIRKAAAATYAHHRADSEYRPLVTARWTVEAPTPRELAGQWERVRIRCTRALRGMP